MPPDRQTLSPQELAEVLQRLDEVMAEAERLRREVTRQLSQQRSDQQQLPSAKKSKARRTKTAGRRARGNG